MRLLSSTSRTCLVLLTLIACNPPEPPPEPAEVPRCCENGGTCMQPQRIDESMLALVDIDVCGEGALCVPDPLLLPLPARSCTLASSGAEGRCLPACLLAGTDQAEPLTRDGCEADQRCMPCFDPVEGTATGACSIYFDRPKQPSVVAEPCGAGAGRCTPAHLVADKSGLGQDTCEEGALCVAQDTSPRSAE